MHNVSLVGRLARPPARFVVRLHCPVCDHQVLAACPCLVPWCPACASGRLRPWGPAWDLCREASPLWLQWRRPATQEPA
jgi:hypothetical protein